MPLQIFSDINPDDHPPGFMDQIMQIMHQQRVEHLSKNPHFSRTQQEQNDIDSRTKKKRLAEKQVAGTYQLAELLTALEIEQYHYEPKREAAPEALVYSEDKPVLNQVTYKQAIGIRAWQVEFRKALKFDSHQYLDKLQNGGTGCDITPRFREFVELTSHKDHPYHKEGQYVQDFINNKFNKWIAFENQYFEQYKVFSFFSLFLRLSTLNYF